MPDAPDPAETPDAPPTGPEGVEALGHRTYVGGMWEEIGRLQFNFLLEQGLLPSHVLLDVACGSLRGGVHFIPYLDSRKYHGLEMEAALVDAALAHELPSQLVEEKAPEFVISSDFEFHRFSRRPDYAIAQSLFTHLVPDDMSRCLTRLRDFVGDRTCRFFVTFFDGDSDRNPATSHTHLAFWYSQSEMESFAADAGWDFEYIGPWGHPRGQMMSCLTPR
jgi:hypothetical protein